jgi:hypothetical protein
MTFLEFRNPYVLHFFEKVTFLVISSNDPAFCRETFPLEYTPGVVFLCVNI